jgi:phosphoribosylformimino-5-aminoimidazole carboxamide ribotide isomerase
MIIPVFDVKEGKCVSGMSGKRDSYTPLQSVYGNDLCEILENLKISGAHAVYVADLDKIESKGDNSELIEKINEVLPVLLDNGANNIDDIIHNRNICRYSILATETMTRLEEIRNIFKENPTERIIISIDIKNNELLIKNKDIKVCVGVGEGEYPLCFLLNSSGDLLLHTSLYQQKQDENLNEVLSLNIITNSI